MNGFRVIEATNNDWSPGRGYYIVGPEYDDTGSGGNSEYLAYCGPLDYPQAKLDAELIASVLNRTQL